MKAHETSRETGVCACVCVCECACSHGRTSQGRRKCQSSNQKEPRACRRTGVLRGTRNVQESSTSSFVKRTSCTPRRRSDAIAMHSLPAIATTQPPLYSRIDCTIQQCESVSSTTRFTKVNERSLACQHILQMEESKPGAADVRLSPNSRHATYHDPGKHRR